MSTKKEQWSEINITIETLKKIGSPIPPELLAKKEQLEKDIESNTPIYDTLIQESAWPVSQEKKDCIEQTVEQLLADVPNAADPCLLLGKIQCGKTDTFQDIIGLAFDKGIDIAIILTKGTKPLLKQTVSRLGKDFKPFEPTDDLDQKNAIRIYDIHDIKSHGLRRALVDGSKTIIACMKNADNLKWLIELFEQKSPFLKEKKVLIVDDEADFASRNYQNIKREALTNEDGTPKLQDVESKLAIISRQIDDFRKIPEYCRYLQVTATPYSLFLQPNGELYLEGNHILSFKPRFTALVPTHAAYVGGDIYFEESKDDTSMFSHLFCPVSVQSISLLGNKKRKNYLSSGIASKKLDPVTAAIIGYLMATAIRSIQRRAERKDYQSSAVFHLNTSKEYHGWQKELIEKILSDIKEYLLSENSDDMRVLQVIDNLYDDFVESNSKGRDAGLISVEVPEKEEVLQEMRDMFQNDDIHVQVVNSNEEVTTLLNDKGQLSLNTTATIFIGGNVIDRGITIDNMLCFFYGRNTTQQDAVLQHARFYGARSMEDMAVTRLHTTPEIFSVLTKMNELDNQLRQWFIDGKDREEPNAVFIGYDKRFKPCATSKIKISEALLVKPGSRELPMGMWTGDLKKIDKKVKKIDKIIASLPDYKNRDENGFFKINKNDAFEILKLIKETYVYDKEHDNLCFRSDIDRLMCVLEYCCPGDGSIYCLHRTDRNANRIRKDNKFTDAPDDGRNDTEPARELAIDRPVLMLFRENGRKKFEDGINKGWNNAPFYWPLVLTQQNLDVSMYAIDIKMNKKQEAVIDISDMYEGIDPKDVLRLTFKGDLVDMFGEEGTEHGHFNMTETRALKETTASRYLLKDENGEYMIKPGFKIDPEKFAGVYTFHNGRFPFVFRPYKYMLLTNGRSAHADAILLELWDPEYWSAEAEKNYDKEGYLIDVDSKARLLHVGDVVRDKSLNEKKVKERHICLWRLNYQIKKVLKFRSVNTSNEAESEYEEN